MPKSLQEFLEFARTDAALLERVALAMRGANAATDVLTVAKSAGWVLNEGGVRAELDGALSEQDLEAVAGGFAGGDEWFAEIVAKKPQIKGKG